MAKRELPKHVYRQSNGIYFQRRGWPSQKFQSEFGTADFWTEYAGILAQKDRPRKVVARNFGALIDHYRKSPRYKNLKPRTGLDYDKYLDFFREIMGDANPANMQRKDVIRLRDTNAEKAYFANYSLRVLRVLMEHCVDLGWRETNPARGVPEIKTAKTEREPWPRELLDVYRAHCALGTRERLVMELCVGTGQRIGDVLSMRWSNIENGAVWVRQSKTSKERWSRKFGPVVKAKVALDAIRLNNWSKFPRPPLRSAPRRLSGSLAR